jgi:hypothetical protein
MTVSMHASKEEAVAGVMPIDTFVLPFGCCHGWVAIN